MAERRRIHNDAGGLFNCDGLGDMTMQRVQTCIDGHHIVYDAAAITNISPDWFDAAYWRARGALTGQAVGRGAAYFFREGGIEYVLRHYRRGGLIARLLRDRYIRRSLRGTRAWREWDMLSYLWREGLPVPRPVAARVKFNGLFYRADIITAKLPAPRKLSDVLKSRPLAPEEWRVAGRLIRRFHEAGVHHADLNAHNIVFAADRMYLLDFDRGRIRAHRYFWPGFNLRRLLRSLRKLARQHEAFHFSRSDWEIFLEAYRSVSDF